MRLEEHKQVSANRFKRLQLMECEILLDSLGEDRANRQSVAGAPDIIIKIFGGPNYGEV